MTRTVTRFILVDDDPIHLKLSTFQIGSLSKSISICSFLQAEKALDHIRSIYDKEANTQGITIIMLNINMDGLSGWDFLEVYETFRKDWRDRIDLFFVSASIDPNDMKKAHSNPNVKDYLIKPLNRSDFINLIGNISIK